MSQLPKNLSEDKKKETNSQNIDSTGRLIELDYVLGIKEKLETFSKGLKQSVIEDVAMIKGMLDQLGAKDYHDCLPTDWAIIEEADKKVDQLESEFLEILNELIAAPAADDVEEKNSPVAPEHTSENREIKDSILKQLGAGLEILKNLPEAEQTDRIKWIIKSVKDAAVRAQASADLTFEVSVDNHSQHEGIPVDDLLEELDKIVKTKAGEAARLKEQKKDYESMRRLANDLQKRYAQVLETIGCGKEGTDQEHQEKIAWHRVYNDLPSDKRTITGKFSEKLRQLVDARRKDWAKSDQEAKNKVSVNSEGNDYVVDSENFSLQTGEALRQVVKKIIEGGSGQINQGRLNELNQELDRIKGITETLQANSRSYFEIRPEMKAEKQHWRTELEAVLVSLDLRSTGDANKDYELAMVAMSKRRELVLPKEAAAESKIEPLQKPKDTEVVLEEVKKKREKVVIVDISEVVKAMAWREAEQKLRFMLDKTNSKFLKRACVRLGEKGYLMKYYKEALSAIQSNQNLMAEIEARILISGVKSENQDHSFEILDAILEEFTQEVIDADESGELVQDDDVNLIIGQLFVDYATSKMTRVEFDQKVLTDVIGLLKQKNKQFSRDTNRQNKAEGLMYANNLFAMAEGYRKQYESQIKELVGKYGEEQRRNIEKQIKGEMVGLDIQLGLRQKDLYETKPKPVLKWYEKFVDLTENIPVLNKVFANPVTYGVVGGIAGSLTGKAAARALAVTGLVGAAGVAPYLAPLLVGAGLGGTFAAMRRSRDLQYDRGLDLRRTTLGVEVDDDAKRTKKIREFNYDIKRAEDCQQNLKVLLVKNDLTKDDKKVVADILARLEVEKEKAVDLIGVSETEGEAHKTKLVAMKDLKVALKDVKNRFNLSSDEEVMRALINKAKAGLINNIEQNDKNFEKFRRKEGRRSAFIGAVTGVVAGAFGQWVSGQFSEHVLGRVPKAESAVEHLYHFIKGDRGSAGSGVIDHLTFQDGRLLDKNGDLLTDNLSVDSETGQIDPEAIQSLREGGVIVNETHTQVTEHFNPASKAETAANHYISNHPDSFHQIHHQGWFDNDTPKLFDKNELQLNFGGVNGTGINEDGDFVFNVAKMAKDGSYHGDFSADAQEAIHNGSLKMMMYLSNESQGQVLDLPINADGNIIIERGSEAAKLFMSVGKDGQAVFNGRFGEIVQSLGVEDGVEQIVPLATISGQGVDPEALVETVTDKFTYTFDLPKQVPIVNPDWDVPPVLPFDPRRPLEGPRQKEKVREDIGENVGVVGSDGGVREGGGNRSTLEKLKLNSNDASDNLPVASAGEIVGAPKVEDNVEATVSSRENGGVAEVEVKRLTLEELIKKEAPLDHRYWLSNQKKAAREWLNGLTREEIDEIGSDNKRIELLKKLVELSYFKSNRIDFQDDEAGIAFNEFKKKLNNSKRKDYSKWSIINPIDTKVVELTN